MGRLPDIGPNLPKRLIWIVPYRDTSVIASIRIHHKYSDPAFQVVTKAVGTNPEKRQEYRCPKFNWES